ncbi:ssDNA endonuclease and repair protein rad10 [Monosporozyma unispora]|nr:ssDNA endonuclease and repair protein rad10 [Kazachstania unispora]
MNNTDPTSFKSILAGVKKLRDQQGGSQETSERASPSPTGNRISKPTPLNNRNTPHIKGALPPNTKVINTFNQQRPTSSIATNGNKSTFNNNKNNKVTSKAVLVNTTQRENPLLDNLKNTSWRYTPSTPTRKVYYDYFVRNRSVLFLSLTYHKVHADYILGRMKPLSSNNDNILLFVIDREREEERNKKEEVDADKNRSNTALTEVTKLCMFNGFTLLVAFNFEQAAKYIEYLNQ